MILLTDCSVSPKQRIGVGGYLCLETIDSLTTTSDSDLGSEIRTKWFQDVSCTELELRTLLWSLTEIWKHRSWSQPLHVYTDSQNIVSLVQRREKLEHTNFLTKSGKKLKHAQIYKEFYLLLDELDFSLHKLRGHSRKSEQTDYEKVFRLLDQSTRRELRKN